MLNINSCHQELVRVQMWRAHDWAAAAARLVKQKFTTAAGGEGPYGGAGVFLEASQPVEWCGVYAATSTQQALLKVVERGVSGGVAVGGCWWSCIGLVSLHTVLWMMQIILSALLFQVSWAASNPARMFDHSSYTDKIDELNLRSSQRIGHEKAKTGGRANVKY